MKCLRLIVLAAAAAGCSKGGAPPTGGGKAEPVATLKTHLAAVGADAALSDEQALKRMADVAMERGAELNVLQPAKVAPKVEKVDGGWALDLHLRDFHSATNYGSAEQVAADAEKTTDLTKGVLANEVTDLLEEGAKRNLKVLRVSLYSPAKTKKGGPEEMILAYRVKATPADAEKILNWRIWPMSVPAGQPRDEEARKKHYNQMWVVEVDEYAKFSLKK